MPDQRKAKLRQLQKKMKSLQDKHPNINLDDTELVKNINAFDKLRWEAFHLKFEIEHCPNCSQILPQYKK